jgi:hypothetical protein
MVDVITPTRTVFGVSGKTPCLLITAADFDGDGEYSTGVDTWDTTFSWIPKAATFIVAVTGTTAAISVKVQGSMDNTNWADTGMAVTAKDTYDYFPNVDWGEPADASITWRYWRVYVTTVGSGNTLNGYIWLY